MVCEVFSHQLFSQITPSSMAREACIFQYCLFRFFRLVSSTGTSSPFMKRFLHIPLYNRILLASEAFVLVNQRNRHFVPKAETTTLQMPKRMKDEICLGLL
jgi:hypothetical protein